MTRHEEIKAASEIIGRAYYCAMDFRTEMRAGYVQCCYENYIKENKVSEIDAHEIRYHCLAMGFDW